MDHFIVLKAIFRESRALGCLYAGWPVKMTETYMTSRPLFAHCVCVYVLCFNAHIHLSSPRDAPTKFCLMRRWRLLIGGAGHWLFSKLIKAYCPLWSDWLLFHHHIKYQIFPTIPYLDPSNFIYVEKLKLIIVKGRVWININFNNLLYPYESTGLMSFWSKAITIIWC